LYIDGAITFAKKEEPDKTSKMVAVMAGVCAGQYDTEGNKAYPDWGYFMLLLAYLSSATALVMICVAYCCKKK